MIDLALLKPSDVGRGVVYSPVVGPKEDGVITSWNDAYVFVRYRGGTTSKATSPEDLDWLDTPLPQVKTFEEWLPIARRFQPNMTDEQLRNNWDAANYVVGDVSDFDYEAFDRETPRYYSYNGEYPAYRDERGFAIITPGGREVPPTSLQSWFENAAPISEAEFLKLKSEMLAEGKKQT